MHGCVYCLLNPASQNQVSSSKYRQQSSVVVFFQPCMRRKPESCDSHNASLKNPFGTRLLLKTHSALSCVSSYIDIMMASPPPSFHSPCWAHSGSCPTTLASFAGLSRVAFCRSAPNVHQKIVYVCVGLTIIMHSILPPLPSRAPASWPRAMQHATSSAIELRTNFQSIYISILGALPGLLPCSVRELFRQAVPRPLQTPVREQYASGSAGRWATLHRTR